MQVKFDPRTRERKVVLAKVERDKLEYAAALLHELSRVNTDGRATQAAEAIGEILSELEPAT